VRTLEIQSAEARSVGRREKEGVVQREGGLSMFMVSQVRCCRPGARQGGFTGRVQCTVGGLRSTAAAAAAAEHFAGLGLGLAW
jgi:hypothetical protein